MSISLEQLGDNDFLKQSIVDLSNRIEVLESNAAQVTQVKEVVQETANNTIKPMPFKAAGRNKKR